MRIAISGSRTFTDRQLVAGVVDELWRSGHHILVGDAPSGVDLFVRERLMELHDPGDQRENGAYGVFKADWNRHGNGAGMIRNQEMLAEAEGFIAIFSEGRRTPGTSQALTVAERLQLPRRVWHLGRWTRYGGKQERVSPLRDEILSMPPDYWYCTKCGTESPAAPDADRLLIDTRYGKKSCRTCKTYTIWTMRSRNSTPTVELRSPEPAVAGVPASL